jgi:cell division protein FtsX
MKQKINSGCISMIAVAAIVGLGALLLWLSTHASAKQGPSQCGNDVQMEKSLKESYGETLAHQGVTRQGNTMVIYTNRKSGTWSIGIKGNNLLCLIVVGEHFKDGSPEL